MYQGVERVILLFRMTRPHGLKSCQQTAVFVISSARLERPVTSSIQITSLHQLMATSTYLICSPTKSRSWTPPSRCSRSFPAHCCAHHRASSQSALTSCSCAATRTTVSYCWTPAPASRPSYWGSKMGLNVQDVVATVQNRKSCMLLKRGA